MKLNYEVHLHKEAERQRRVILETKVIVYLKIDLFRRVRINLAIYILLSGDTL